MGFSRTLAASAAARGGTLEELVEFALREQQQQGGGGPRPPKRLRASPLEESAAAPKTRWLLAQGSAVIDLEAEQHVEEGKEDDQVVAVPDSEAGRIRPGASASDGVEPPTKGDLLLETSSLPRACSLCAEDFSAWRTVQLPCGHGWYCSGCMERHTQARLDLGSHEVPCPECGKQVSEVVLRAVLPPALLEQLASRSLGKAVGASGDLWPCPTPDCANCVALEEGQVPRLQCTFCGKEHCLRCHASPYHKGLTCEQHAAKQKRDSGDDGTSQLHEWMEQTGSKQCPKCKMVVTKDNLTAQTTQHAECHKMICRNCGAKFCFRCLASLEHSTCGCTGNDHGFIDPHTGDWVEHRLARGRAGRRR